MSLAHGSGTGARVSLSVQTGWEFRQHSSAAESKSPRRDVTSSATSAGDHPHTGFLKTGVKINGVSPPLSGTCGTLVRSRRHRYS